MTLRRVKRIDFESILKRISNVLIICISIAGLAVLLGWYFDIQFIKRPIPELVAMNPATAICFILLGISGWLSYSNERESRSIYVSAFLVLLLTISLWKLIDSVVGLDVHIDEILFSNKLKADALNDLSSQMAPNTAVAFLLSGIIVYYLKNKRLIKYAQLMAIIVMSIALLAILGYLFQVREFYGILAFLPMAIHTSICFLLFTISILFQTNNKGFVADITGSFEGGNIGRVMIPFALLMPIALGYFWLNVFQEDYLTVELSTALMTTSMSIIFVLIVGFAAASINRQNRIKRLTSAKIKTAHNLLQSSIESFNDVLIFSINARYELLNFNSAFKKATDSIYGVDIAENMNLLDCMTNDQDHEKAKRNFDKALSGESHMTIEVYGDTICFETRYRPIKEDDKIIGITVLSTDITERRKMEQHIKQATDRLLLATKGSKIGIWDYDVINNNLIWDDRMYELYGFRQSRVNGAYKIWRNGMHPEDLERGDREIQQAIKGEKEFNTEYRVIWPDNSIHYIRALALVQRDGNGITTRMTGTSWDITESKQVELKLKTLDRAILEIEDYSIILLNPDGTIINWNNGAEKIKGYSAAEIIGKNFSIFYTEEDRNAQKPLKIIEAAKEEWVIHDEGWRVRKDGSKFWAGVTITCINDEEGKLTGFSKVTKDLTERRQAEEAKRKIALLELKKSKEMEQFAYITSHDLKEPLLTIKNYIQLLIEESGENLNEDARHFANSIFNASKRMESLILGLLDYSRLSKPKELSEVDSEQVLESVKLDLDSLITSKEASIIAEGLPKLRAYPLEFKLLFQNLIHNAIKFSRKDVPPVINIGSEKIEGGWQFTFSDNGIGINSKDFEKVFTIFRKAHNKRHYEGTGIGLAHAKKIADIHNGSIWVESEVGKGTTFRFNILTENL